MAIQHESLHNYTQALLFYQIAENLKEQNFPENSNSKRENENFNNKDALYKYKLVKQIPNEKKENLDKIGTHFLKV